MARVDVNRLLTEILRPPLAAEPVPKPIVQTKMPAEYLGRLAGGLVYARKVTGSGMHPKFAEFADIQVDVYASEYDVAQALANKVDEIIYDAWWNQTVYASGYISSYESPVTPFEFPDPQAPDDTCRFTAEYRLLLRPPA